MFDLAFLGARLSPTVQKASYFQVSGRAAGVNINVLVDFFVNYDDNGHVELPKKFNGDGLLPPGDYEVTFSGLRDSLLVRGAGARSTGWDEAWRLKLVGNLEVMVRQLWAIGIGEIFLDGSFVEEKDHPNDIDGYFVCEIERLVSRELHRELNALEPMKVWTWDHKSRVFDPGSFKKQLPMWHQYRVELYPHYGQGTGITDPMGNELEFPSAFRQTRGAGLPKGIVKIIKEVH